MTYRKKKLLEIAHENPLRRSHFPTTLAEMPLVSIVASRSLPSLRRRDAGSPTGGPSFVAGDEGPMKRASVYAGGFSLYDGCLKVTPCKWLDLSNLCGALSKLSQAAGESA